MRAELILFLLRRFRQPRSDLWTRQRCRRTIGVGDVVVTDPLRRWHALKTLALVYRDAYNNQLNDRYKGKWTEYEQLAKATEDSYLQIGVGWLPVLSPKAMIPVLNTTPGTGPAATYYVAVAWVNQTGQSGSASEVAQLTTSTGQQLVVSRSNPPSNATGWNAYVGEAPEATSLQNSSPIAIGSHVDLNGGAPNGGEAGPGPTADVVSG